MRSKRDASSSSMSGGPCPQGMYVRAQAAVPLFSFVLLSSFVVEEPVLSARHVCLPSMFWAETAAPRVACLATRCVQTFVITV